MCLVAHSCLALFDPMDCSPPGSSVHGNSPGKNTGVGCHALLQGIFPTQGWNPGLPQETGGFFTVQADSLLSEPAGKPRLLRPTPNWAWPNASLRGTRGHAVSHAPSLKQARTKPRQRSFNSRGGMRLGAGRGRRCYQLRQQRKRASLMAVSSRRP